MPVKLALMRPTYKEYTMGYFYIHLSNGDVYGSFDTESEALRYANNAGFTCDWELVEGNE
jgi:hypothetical protein